VVGIPLTDSRRALQVAGEYVTDDSMFVEQMVQAMTEAAGFAIETGHDDLASDAIQNVTDLETLVSDDDFATSSTFVFLSRHPTKLASPRRYCEERTLMWLVAHRFYILNNV